MAKSRKKPRPVRAVPYIASAPAYASSSRKPFAVSPLSLQDAISSSHIGGPALPPTAILSNDQFVYTVPFQSAAQVVPQPLANLNVPSPSPPSNTIEHVDFVDAEVVDVGLGRDKIDGSASVLPQLSFSAASIGRTPSACSYADVISGHVAPVSAFGSLPCAETSVDPSAATKHQDTGNPKVNNWTSLFKSLPKNAGCFSPSKFATEVVDGVNIPPLEVIQEGVRHWKEHLVGYS